MDGCPRIPRDTIVIQEDLKQNRCDLIHDFTLPFSPSVSFEPVPALTELTLFKSPLNFNIDINPAYAHKRCNDFIIHYDLTNYIPVLPPLPQNQPNHTFIPPAEYCSKIQYPINMSIGELNNLVALLTSDITLLVHAPQNVFTVAPLEAYARTTTRENFRVHIEVIFFFFPDLHLHVSN